MHKQATEFDADEFLYERQIGKVSDGVVAVLNAIGSARGARRDHQIIPSGDRNARAVSLRRPRRPETPRNGLAAEDRAAVCAVIAGFEVERPGAYGICLPR